MMVLKAEDFINNLLRLKDETGSYDQVIIPFRPEQGSGYFKKIENVPLEKINLTSFRTGTAAKYLFYFPRERVYPLTDIVIRRVVAGIKACDLKALELLDKALLKGGFTEPAYQKWRDNTVVISSDCSEICETCSCNLMGGKPYPESGYDINISKLNGNFLLAIGSVKGAELLQKITTDIDYRDALQEEKQIVEKNREEILSRLQVQNEMFNHDNNNNNNGDIRNLAENFWMEKSADCIGCGACTNVCPTCYCLILNDDSVKNNFIKTRSYDSCQWYGYARVAGGGTPRPKMHMRFRNRYLCKLDYMQNNFGTLGCTGCGRCTEACAAGIDFREVVTEISSGSFNKIENF
jgi:sulfhydrogenase subunit beta (sulfur reductase)